MFPRDRLFYLTPHSDNIIKKIDPDAVLIVGGIVDMSSNKPLTLAKAKRQRIKHGKLPLGQYVEEFKPGSSQAFSLHVIGEILLELKDTNDWAKAFEKIPNRYTANIRKSLRNNNSSFIDSVDS